MNKLIAFISVLLLCSCSERNVQLPQLSQANLPSEITNYSPIYIFFDENSGQADLNRKNMISTTHWVFNIDKRLTLSEVGKTMLTMQKKRATMSFHNNPDAKNYFSIADMYDQKYKFLDFTNTQFQVLTDVEHTNNLLIISDLKDMEEMKKNLKNNPTGTVYIDGNLLFQDFIVFLQKAKEEGILFNTIAIID